MTQRRELLQHSATVAGLLATLGWLPREARAADAPGYTRSAFDAKSIDEGLKALNAGALTESAEVVLKVAEIAENGAVVPVVVSSTAARVNKLLLLIEKNPAVLAATFDVNESVDASMAVRVKMAQSSQVYGVALTADGKALFARKEVKVTLGGCGG